MSFVQIGIWRSSSGTREAGCNSFSVSRMRLSALSILLRNRKRGIFSVFELAQDQLQLRQSCARRPRRPRPPRRRAGSTARMSWTEFDRAGAIDEGVAVAHEFVVATSTLRRSSGAGAPPCWQSPTVVSGLDRALPLDRAGARQDRFEERRLAAWKGPTSAMHRGPLGFVPAVLCHGFSLCRRGSRAAAEIGPSREDRDGIVSGDRRTGKRRTPGVPDKRRRKPEREAGPRKNRSRLRRAHDMALRDCGSALCAAHPGYADLDSRRPQA